MKIELTDENINQGVFDALWKKVDFGDGALKKMLGVEWQTKD